jgi:hypothetical protein
VFVYFVQCFFLKKITQAAPILGLLFSGANTKHFVMLTKMYLATLWGIFSQTDLVTLAKTETTQVRWCSRFSIPLSSG